MKCAGASVAWGLSGMLFASPLLAADAEAGRSVFRQSCSVCHTAEAGDNGGAEGPSLNGVFNRPAASLPQFTYSPALIASHLTWDAATLNRFLASPTTVVPGSSMVIAVASGGDRDNLIT